MEQMNLNPAMTLFAVRSKLIDTDFTLIDVGCSGGIHDHWRVFGERLSAYGFDPQRQECARLNQREKGLKARYSACFAGLLPWPAKLDRDNDPKVRYFPYFVGLEPDHWFHRERQQRSSPQSAYFAVPTPQLSSGFALECSSAVQEQSNPINEDLTSDRISVSRFVQEHSVQNADFVKIDTDGADLEALLSCEELIQTGCVLGFMIESPFTGSDHPTANSFHNIDRFMRQHGYCLYNLSANRYSRRALPSPFVLTIAAQTETGQCIWGDSLYFLNPASRHFAAVVGKTLRFEKLLKLACLFELFALKDCAAELILHHRDVFASRTDPDHLLNLLTPPLRGKSCSYADYIKLFREDVFQFFPRWSEVQKKPEVQTDSKAASNPTRQKQGALAALLRAVMRRTGAARTGK